MSKLRWSWLGLGWIWVIAIFYLSLMPHPPEPLPMGFWGADKLEHALSYCLLMLWFSQIYTKLSLRLLLTVLLLAMGIAIEYLQGETGYRFFEYADMLANASGVMLGWVWARTALGGIFLLLETHFARKSTSP